MIDLASYSYPKGLHLLKSWQAGTEEAKAEIKAMNEKNRLEVLVAQFGCPS